MIKENNEEESENEETENDEDEDDSANGSSDTENGEPDEDSFVMKDKNDITSLLSDYSIEEQLQRKYQKEIAEINDEEVKSMNKWLWSIIKTLPSRKISTDSIKRLILHMKWELMFSINERNWLKSLLDENEAKTDKMQKEKESAEKQLSDTRAELAIRKKTLADLTSQKVEDLDRMKVQPESFGYLLTKNQFHILKVLDEGEKGMTYTQLKELLVLNQNSKQMSNQTMNDNLKALVSKQAFGFAEHNDNGIYSINDAGRLALNSSKGNI